MTDLKQAAQRLIDRIDRDGASPLDWREYDALLIALEQQAEPPTCAWSPEDDDTMPGTYRSACGELWSFIDGTWQDNRVRYCHGCGGKVVEDAHDIKEPKPS